ncbi:MAG: HAMP domain-containing histidine kinase [Flavobacteriales bacterium]|nr:HAMP domain-containing histidine kinase [Flavobacteriales bacterium]
MNNKLISWLILGISISLVALVSIQLFWVSNAIRLKKDEFDINVRDALGRTVSILEKDEALKKIKSHQQGRFLFAMDDSSEINSLTPRDSSHAYLIYKELEKKDEGIEVKIVEEQGGKRKVTDLITIGQHAIPDPTSNEELDYQLDNSKGGYYSSNLKVNLDTAVKNQLVNKTILVSDIVKSLIEVDLSEKIEDRIDPVYVQSLLKYHLKEQGVDADFYFAVFDQDDNLRTGNTNDPSILPNHGYTVHLFPNDVINHKSTLRLYFPGQIQYIFSSISWLLLASILIIITIFMAFYYSIRTILRQKKLSEIKNDFINNMTHELKTPISTISLACEALTDPDVSATPSLMTRYIGIIRDENKRLGNQVENVLRSAIWDNKAFRLNKELTDINDIAVAAVSKFEMQLRDRKGKIEVQCDAEDATMMVDKEHLFNVIKNLIDNAIKYSKDAPEILVRTYTEKDHVLIDVEDNGIGISKENQKRVFEKLYRVPTGNVHDVKGFGLGLNYVKSIAERHGGRVTVSSKLNKGSIFTVALPLKQLQ